MSRVVAFFWPLLGRAEGSTETAESELAKDLASIRSAAWKQVPDAMEHARQLTETENGRKQSADSKASLYLAVIAAIVPILGSLVPDFYQDAGRLQSGMFGVILLLLFVLGMAYLIASGVWAFRTLKVSTYSRVDIAEFVAASMSKDPEDYLIKEVLCAVRTNRDEVNTKTSYIRMAHEFLVRTFLTFALLLVVIVLWKSAAAAICASTAFGMRVLDFVGMR
jgi:hypothetical protein